MKSKIYLAFALMLAVGQSFAQCGDRYKEEIFQSYTITTDTYSVANGRVLLMDVYQPVGDVETNRPVIIMAHGGSFVGGSKTEDPTVIYTCQTYAKRGYVTVAINYRLAANPLLMLDSANAKDIVVKAISDGKAAIRYFRKDAATVNKYNVNPNLIFAGGNSAGAVLYSHAAYIDSVGELSADMQNIVNNNGGLDGNSGNDGYSSKFQALINYAGGLNIPELIGPGNTPSANFHGDQDATVPYGCANAVDGNVQVRLCGLGALQPFLTQFGLRHVSKVYPGKGHVPWTGSSAEAQALTVDVDTITRNFLYEIVCENSVGIKNVAEGASVKVYPNPTKGVLNITFSEPTFKSVQLVDGLGRVVEQKNVENASVSFNKGTLSAGFYFIKAQQANGNTVTKKVIFE